MFITAKLLIDEQPQGPVAGALVTRKPREGFARNLLIERDCQCFRRGAGLLEADHVRSSRNHGEGGIR